MHRPVFSLSSRKTLCHSPGERHSRHSHAEGFIAVVLSGNYDEIGDTGSWAVEPGNAIVHAPFEAHYNGIGAKGAQVLLLPFSGSDPRPGLNLVDPDAAARIAETDPFEAARFVLDRAATISPLTTDWPDMLAADLRCRPDTKISFWARQNGLDPAVVSRGFRRHFGCSPSQYRLKSRVRAAIADIRAGDNALVAIAHECGFADQAHFSRAVRKYTGLSPTALRTQFSKDTDSL